MKNILFCLELSVCKSGIILFFEKVDRSRFVVFDFELLFLFKLGINWFEFFFLIVVVSFFFLIYFCLFNFVLGYSLYYVFFCGFFVLNIFFVFFKFFVFLMYFDMLLFIIFLIDKMFLLLEYLILFVL